MAKIKVFGEDNKRETVTFEEVAKGGFFLYKEILFVKTDAFSGMSLGEGVGGNSRYIPPEEEVEPVSVDFYC